VTVRAPDFALLDLGSNGVPGCCTGRQHAEHLHLVALVVELKDDRIRLTAIHAWMLEHIACLSSLGVIGVEALGALVVAGFAPALKPITVSTGAVELGRRL
jgi:hypothetical protein